jgi:hypothetical protein
MPSRKRSKPKKPIDTIDSATIEMNVALAERDIACSTAVVWTTEDGEEIIWNMFDRRRLN